MELTMCPTGIPKDLLFFAMLTHTLGYKLNSNTLHGSVTQKRAPPKHNAHSSHTNRKIHHLVLLVASCLEGKSCHSNKPQKRKHGCQVETVLRHCLKKYCYVGTQTTQMQLMCG